MGKQIFREKNMERISSPEQLNEYIRVASPAVWMVLSAILVLFAGACVWGFLGHLDTKVSGVFVSQDEKMYVYLQEEDAKKVQPGMPVFVGETEYVVGESAAMPAAAKEVLDDYGLYVSGFSPEAWVYQVSVSGDYVEGTIPAEVIVESIAPMTFIFN